MKSIVVLLTRISMIVKLQTSRQFVSSSSARPSPEQLCVWLMGWAGLGVTLTRLLTPLLSRDNICKHCFYVLQFSGRNNEEDVGKSRPRWLHHRNLVTWGSNTLTFPQTLDLGLSPGVQRQPSSYCHRRSVENRGYSDRAPQWQNTFVLIQYAFGHANCFRYVLYCGVSTPLGCAVVLSRAMLGYLCKLLDEGGTKKWKITKILDSPIAAWPRRAAAAPPAYLNGGMWTRASGHRHSLHVSGTTKQALPWHNSVLPWMGICGIQFLQSLHSPEKLNTLWINILRKLYDYHITNTIARYDHEVEGDGRWRWNLILWPGGKCYH